MELIYLFAGLLIGVLIAFFYFRSKKEGTGMPPEKYNELDRRYSVLEERNRNHEQEILRIREELLQEKAEAERQLEEERQRMGREHQAEKDKIEKELQAERSRANELDITINRSREAFKAQEQRLLDKEQQLAEQKEEFGRMQQQLSTQFENVAGKLLEEKSKKFTELNKTNLDVLLNPLKENIKAFEEKVEKTYKAESDERNVLKGTVLQMMELNRQLSEDTNNLTKALKGDSKKQGNWGEVILGRILERSGLVEGENYVIQGKEMKLRDEEGNLLQPDVVVNLPENKHIIIDSKVSLVAYERMVTAETDQDRERFLKQHIQSVRAHVMGLSSKEYANLYGINSPDFVLLFIPIESSFSIAVQHDAELFSFAWDKKVVVVSPSTMLATLRTVASIWKQEKQTRNAQEIAGRAGALYDKFAGFVEDLEKIGKNLGLTQKAYDDAFGKLQRGRGNLLNRVENLRKLGARASKQLDTRYLDDDETLEE